MWRRTLQPEALNLVRVLPIQNGAWISARIAAIPTLATPSRYWAELRDQVLILYPATHILLQHRRFLDNPPKSYVQSSLPCANSVSQLETLPLHHICHLATLIPSFAVIAFLLPSVRLTCREATHSIHLRPNRIRPAAQIHFDSPTAVSQWRLGFESAVARDRKRLSDFRIVKHVGKGASGRVYEIEDKLTAERLALKVIEKSTVLESKDTYRHAMDERLVLQMIRHHPYILNMHYAFQNSKRLFIVTEFCEGGDMFEFMNRRVAPLDEVTARFVSAQVLLALSHLHSLGIVYRDLKLENILIDSDGNIRLADFGLTKILRQNDGKLSRTTTFCGTREYVAPEMLRGDPYDTALDFWTFGILLYEMLSGRTPFYSSDHSEIYKRIEKSNICYPRSLSPQVRNLISKLLVREPEKRLGASKGGIAILKHHPWFSSIDWDKLMDRHAIISPLKKSIEYLRKQTDRMSALITMSGHVPKKSRNEAKQEKALASVVADVHADQKLASNRTEKNFHRRALTWSGSLLRKGRSRAQRSGDVILAGYAYNDNQFPDLSDATGLSLGSHSTEISSNTFWILNNLNRLEGDEGDSDQSNDQEDVSEDSIRKTHALRERRVPSEKSDTATSSSVDPHDEKLPTSESPTCIRATANSRAQKACS